MNRKKISLRWRAQQLYHRSEVPEADLSDYLVQVWRVLEGIESGEIAISPPRGGKARVFKIRVAASDGGRFVYVSIGCPKRNDPDNQADYFIEDIWIPGHLN